MHFVLGSLRQGSARPAAAPIVLTAIGGALAQAVATILRHVRPHTPLIGCDQGEEHAGAHYVDTLLQVPPASDPAYVPTLRRVIAREGAAYVFPLSEPELRALAPVVNESASWITPGAQAIDAGVDKLATAQALHRLRVPSPWTAPSHIPTPSLPCVFKARFGSGGRHVHVVQTQEGVRYFSSVEPVSIVQEYLTGEYEVTCAVYRTYDDRVGTLQMRRHLAGGSTRWAKVVRDPRIDALCTTIAEGLDVRGAINVQLRVTESGPRVFEINPRYSSTVDLRHALGWTDVVWALDEAEGRPVVFPDVKVGAVVARTHGAVVLT